VLVDLVVVVTEVLLVVLYLVIVGLLTPAVVEVEDCLLLHQQEVGVQVW
jgi:hypothetical protein